MEYRPDDWWLNAMKNYSEQQWLSNFRTRKETFSMLTTLSRSELEPGVFVRHYRYINELRLQYTNWDQPLNLGPQGTCLGYIEHLFTDFVNVSSSIESNSFFYQPLLKQKP
ncbi:uncharacterized protein LOC120337415 [Styela clava]